MYRAKQFVKHVFGAKISDREIRHHSIKGCLASSELDSDVLGLGTHLRKHFSFVFFGMCEKY